MRTYLFAIVCLVSACTSDSSGDGNGSGSGSGSGSNQPETGASLFADNCATCHGDDGAGSLDGPTVLSPVTGFATYVVRNGRGAEMGFSTGMDPFDTTDLTDDQLTKVLTFLQSAPHPTTGADLYGRYCINCHGKDGRSGRVRINIVSHVLELQLKVRYGHGGTNYGARTSYMPAWPATEISDADLTALRTYVQSL
jgi:mono/diheme cytochrome c family protein